MKFLFLQRQSVRNFGPRKKFGFSAAKRKRRQKKPERFLCYYEEIHKNRYNKRINFLGFRQFGCGFADKPKNRKLEMSDICWNLPVGTPPSPPRPRVMGYHFRAPLQARGFAALPMGTPTVHFSYAVSCSPPSPSPPGP